MSEIRKGKFITLEGCEGVGKSKQISYLKEYFEKNGIPYILTREPGGSKIAEQIRGIILDGNNKEMADGCEALLYAAARVQHLFDTVIPALNEGKIVLCDRYIDSSFAYQAYARGLGFDFVEKINDFAINGYMPDVTLFLNLAPEQAFKRKGGVDANDRVELSGMEFHNAVYQGYLSLAEKYPERIVSIDCSGEKHETHAKIIKALKDKKII